MNDQRDDRETMIGFSDTIGLFGIGIAFLVWALAPNFYAKLFAILFGAALLAILAIRSHITLAWPLWSKTLCALSMILLIALYAGPQLRDQWAADHPHLVATQPPTTEKPAEPLQPHPIKNLSRADLTIKFKDLANFTGEQKQMVRRTILEYNRYLTSLGFQLPKEFPPIGLGEPGGVTWSRRTDEIADFDLTLSSNDLLHPSKIREQYSYIVFAGLFRQFDPRSKFFRLDAEWVYIFHHYFLGSFENKNLAQANLQKDSEILNGLWKIRTQYGRPFTDHLMFYVLERWWPISADEESNLGSETMESLFWRRFKAGELAVVNDRTQSEAIDKILKDQGLNP